ncbi:hypothetical protein ACWDYH_24970 [Nocardia goodfellowii]
MSSRNWHRLKKAKTSAFLRKLPEVLVFCGIRLVVLLVTERFFN